MSETKRTMFATKALGLAEIFKMSIGNLRLEGPVTYAPDLSTPEGESTGGGRQAVQHLMLIPEGGGTTLVMGTANTVDKHAELRTFEHVAELHRRRFKGASLSVDKARYDELLEKVLAFFRDREFQVGLVDAPPASAASGAHGVVSAESAGPSRKPIIIALAAVVLLAVAFLVLRR